jgi:hypothetical protein
MAVHDTECNLNETFRDWLPQEASFEVGCKSLIDLLGIFVGNVVLALPASNSGSKLDSGD